VTGSGRSNRIGSLNAAGKRFLVMAITSLTPRARYRFNDRCSREIAMTSFTPRVGIIPSNCGVGRQGFDATEEFRAHTAECQALANRWHDEGKRQYEDLARQWLKLAELAAGQCGENRSGVGDSAPSRSVLAHG